MPRLTLTFDLPDERHEAAIAVRAQELIRALYEIESLINRDMGDHEYHDTQCCGIVSAIRDEIERALAFDED
jgi:hypothetical protein